MGRTLRFHHRFDPWLGNMPRTNHAHVLRLRKPPLESPRIATKDPATETDAAKSVTLIKRKHFLSTYGNSNVITTTY